MRKAKQITDILMAGTMVSTVLAGCINEPALSSTSRVEAGKDSGAGSGVPAAPGDRITLRFMRWDEDERSKATLVVIGQYQKLHPEVRTEAEMNFDQGYTDKVSAMLANGMAPDILRQDADSLPDLVSRGDFFVGFYEYRDTFDTSGFDETFISQFGTLDGELLALPTGTSCLATVANRNTVKTCSVDLTKQITRDSMLEDGKKLHAENPDYYYMSIDIKILCEYVLRPYLRQTTGRSFIVDSEKKMSFTGDQLVEMFTHIKDCYDGGVSEPAGDSVTSKGQIHTNPEWTDGKFISAHGPSFNTSLLMDAVLEAECIAMQMPMAKGRVNDGFLVDMPQYVTANKNSEHVEEAVDFLNYFYNNTKAQETLKDVRSIPLTSTVRQLRVDKGLLNQTVVDAVDLAAGLSGRSDKGYTTNAEVYAIQEDMIESIAYGQSTPEEVADNVIELINDHLSGLRQKAPESNIKEIGRRPGHPFPGRLKDGRKIGWQRRS